MGSRTDFRSGNTGIIIGESVSNATTSLLEPRFCDRNRTELSCRLLILNVEEVNAVAAIIMASIVSISFIISRLSSNLYECLNDAFPGGFILQENRFITDLAGDEERDEECDGLKCIEIRRRASSDESRIWNHVLKN